MTNNHSNNQKHMNGIGKLLTMRVINCSRLNVRKDPSLLSEILAQLDKGSHVTITDKSLPESGWYKIVTQNGIEGYCVREFLE